MAISIYRFQEGTLKGLIMVLATAHILSRDIQIETVQEYQNGKQEALDRLVKSNIRLCQNVAKQHNRDGISHDDLLQSAVEGVIIAANKYKVGSQMAFSTYARKWMVAKCQEYVRNNLGTIRVGSRVAKTLYASLPKFRRAYVAQHGKEPNTRDIANRFGYGIPEVEKALQLMGRYATPIDTPIGEDSNSGTLESVLPSNIPNPEALLNRKREIQSVRKAIGSFGDKLSPRDQDIFQSYIVNGESGPIVGERHGISRQRVSQIGGKLKKQFKAHLIGNNIRPRL